MPRGQAAPKRCAKSVTSCESVFPFNISYAVNCSEADFPKPEDWPVVFDSVLAVLSFATAVFVEWLLL